MDLSLIISTRNRSDSLLRTLDSLCRMESSFDWELVVVDNGSTDDTPKLLRRFSDRSGLNVVLVTEPTPGLANARNAGCGPRVVKCLSLRMTIACRQAIIYQRQ